MKKKLITIIALVLFALAVSCNSDPTIPGQVNVDMLGTYTKDSGYGPNNLLIFSATIQCSADTTDTIEKHVGDLYNQTYGTDYQHAKIENISTNTKTNLHFDVKIFNSASGEEDVYIPVTMDRNGETLTVKVGIGTGSTGIYTRTNKY